MALRSSIVLAEGCVRLIFVGVGKTMPVAEGDGVIAGCGVQAVNNKNAKKNFRLVCSFMSIVYQCGYTKAVPGKKTLYGGLAGQRLLTLFTRPAMTLLEIESPVQTELVDGMVIPQNLSEIISEVKH